MSKSKAKK